VSAISDDI